jgi:hypothetical protein
MAENLCMAIRNCIEKDIFIQKLKEFIGLDASINTSSSILPACKRGEADLAVSCIYISMVCTHNHEIRQSVNWPPPPIPVN